MATPNSIKKSIAIVGGLPSSLYNFRGDLIRCLKIQEWDVLALASKFTEEDITEVTNLGAVPIDYPLKRNQLDPWHDCKTILSLLKIFNKNKPQVIFTYTIKPTIWGGLAARLTKGSHHVAFITGLGYSFQKKKRIKAILRFLVIILYRIALKHTNAVVFQNQHNLDTFVTEGIVPLEKCSIVGGSGVNLEHFGFTPLDNKNTIFLIIARLLKDKGFQHYLEAAEIVKHSYPEAKFHIVGPEDKSLNAFPLKTIQHYENKGIVQYFGPQADVRPYLNECQIYVLPSYHEGMPRSVLEAMSIGRPVITTDAPGCRDTVDHGVTGYIVPPGDSLALAEAIETMIKQRSYWGEMGKRGRLKSEKTFDIKIVNQSLLEIIDKCLSN